MIKKLQVQHLFESYQIYFQIQMSNKNECVKVAVRCRPMSHSEVEAGYETIVHIKPERGEVLVTNTKDVGEKQRVFSFDMAFEPTCEQKSIFDHAALPIIESVLQGYNGTIFAYGQTGTGKTHTMEGSKTVENERGVIPRTFEHVIKSIEGTPGVNFMIQVSMLQLYNQEVVDLLSGNRKQKLQIHEDKDKGVYVKDLSAFMVKTVQDMNNKLKEGSKSRHVGSTQMNSVSSRSHSIFVIRIEQQQEIEQESKIKAGRLNLVDLAGSQRQKKTQATGVRSKQGIYINSALSVLGQVIGALTSATPTHVPYRDSKLTRLLQESLGGNARTIMIANVGPASFNYEETMSTLRYAYQAKKIKNKPKINDDPKDALIREYQEEIQRLKKQLEGTLPPDGVQVIEKRVKVSTKRQNLTAKLQKQKEKELQKQKEQVLGLALSKKDELKNKALTLQQQKQNQKKRQQELAIKLKQMKAAFLRGNKVKEEARLHQKKIMEANLELEERIQRQRRMEQELKKRIDEEDEVKERNLSLKEEVEHRRTQLKKLNNKLKIAYEQNNDIQEFMAQQRQELQQENRSLVRQLKLVNMIIEHFVPIQEVAAIQHRLQFDEGFDDWIIVQNSQRPKPNPGSALGLKAPLCTQGRMSVACGDDNPRFRQQNIIMMDLNLVDSPTESFESYQISQSILENLSVALNDNEEEQRMIAREERPNVYIDDPEKMNKQQIMRQRQNSTRAKSAKKMRPASGKKKK